jgi:hypothetical protein
MISRIPTSGERMLLKNVPRTMLFAAEKNIFETIPEVRQIT